MISNKGGDTMKIFNLDEIENILTTAELGALKCKADFQHFLLNAGFCQYTDNSVYCKIYSESKDPLVSLVTNPFYLVVPTTISNENPFGLCLAGRDHEDSLSSFLPVVNRELFVPFAYSDESIQTFLKDYLFYDEDATEYVKKLLCPLFHLAINPTVDNMLLSRNSLCYLAGFYTEDIIDVKSKIMCSWKKSTHMVELFGFLPHQYIKMCEITQLITKTLQNFKADLKLSECVGKIIREVDRNPTFKKKNCVTDNFGKKMVEKLSCILLGEGVIRIGGFYAIQSGKTTYLVNISNRSINHEIVRYNLPLNSFYFLACYLEAHPFRSFKYYFEKRGELFKPEEHSIRMAISELFFLLQTIGNKSNSGFKTYLKKNLKRNYSKMVVIEND